MYKIQSHDPNKEKRLFKESHEIKVISIFLKIIRSKDTLDLSYRELDDETFKIIVETAVTDQKVLEKLCLITELNLSSNQLTQFEKEHLDIFRNLKVLTLKNNKFNTVPDCLKPYLNCHNDNIKSLKVDLSENQLTTRTTIHA